MAVAEKKAPPKGTRWVTVKKEGPLHGRRLLIDGKGFVVGGKIPEAMHGHHIGRLSGILPEGQSYHSYSHDELKEIHAEFKQHHDDLKKQLAEDIHGHAKGLRDAHVSANKENNLISKIRAKGGIKIAEGHQNHTEYKESVDPDVRKAVSSKGGIPLDEMADELGMSARDLIDKLSQAETSSYAKIEDFHGEAKKQMGDDYEQRLAGVKEMGKHVAAIEAAMKVHEHKKAQEKAAKEKEPPKEEPKAKEGHEMTRNEFHEAHPNRSRDDNARMWMSTLKQAHAEGKQIPKNVLDAHPDLQALIDNGFKPIRTPKEKLAGEGMPFKKEQTVRNNKFLEHAEGAFGVHEQDRFKDVRKILHKEGYDAALKYIGVQSSGYGNSNQMKMTAGEGKGKTKMEHLRDLAEADKAKGNGHAPGSQDAPKESGIDPNELKNEPKPTGVEPGKNLAEQKDSGKKLSDLHNDIQAHLNGEMSENDFFKKHLNKFRNSGEKVGKNGGGDAEDVGGSALETAVKTLRALKSGSQKPKEGTDLGDHLLSRVKQGSKEATRQGNENSMTREGAKLAAIVNQHRNAHMNETGKDPSEEELFNRVKEDKAFQDTKFTAPGTKKSVDDHREKFNAVREAMKGQRSDAVLDKQVEGKDGNVGTVGGNMADPKGSAEDQVVDLENKREMNARRDQLHGAFKEMGLSDHEAHAVSNRFGVGHTNQGFQDWDTVAKHMSKALGKKVSPDSAKKHFQNGRAKLHQHIGDERMGLLMQKSLIVDPAVQNLIYHLHLCGIYDLLKSQGMEDENQLESVWERTAVSMDRGELIKSLAPDEYIGEEATWADGSVTAQIHKFHVRGN